MANNSSLFQFIGVPLILIGALEFLLALILFRSNRKNSPVNKAVSAFSFFTGVFAFITGLMYVRASFGHDITFLARSNWISWMMIPAGLQFVFYMRDERSRAARWAGLVLYPFWFSVFCISLSTDLIETGNYTLLPFVDHSGPLNKPLRLVAFGLILWAMFEVYRLRREVFGIKRAQLNYFAHGVLIFSGGGALLAVVLQLFGGLGFEPGLASYFSLPWVVLTFYAITRYRLFDIRIIVARTVAITLLVCIFSLVQIGFFAVLEPHIGPSWTIVISLFFIGFVFYGTHFMRSIQQWVRQLVLQESYNYQQMLKDASKAVVTILQLEELLPYLLQSIKTSLGVGDVRLYLKTAAGGYLPQFCGSSRGIQCPEQAIGGSLVEWIMRTRQAAVREELEGALPDHELAVITEDMKKAGLELAVPLISKGDLLGILTLGKKGNLEAYVRSDIEILEVLSGHAAVAIENATLYEESRRAQESLRESQERFRSLIETTSDWVWEIDDRGVYTYVSPKIRELLGYEPEEMLGKTYFDFMPKAEAKRAADFFVSLTIHKQPFMMYKSTNLHKSGRLVIVETSGVPVFDKGGRFAGYRGIDRDVTERNRLEGRLRYAQKMEAIGRLAAGVAHDFNNINTVIIGQASLIQLKLQKDDLLRHPVDQILGATERAANLTRSLLIFSQKDDVELRPLNINAVIKDMERLMLGVVRENIELRFVLSEKDLIIAGNPAQLERIVMNLSSNARDAMPNGGRLTVTTEDVAMDEEFMAAHGYGKPGSYARISVADNGIGMEEPVRQKIFEPFFTTKGAGRGTGFGLSIVYDIVKQNNGYITVASTVGKGTTFQVYLPLVDKPAPAMTPIPRTSRAGQYATVLIADDDEDDRKLIRGALEGAGCSVLEAVDGEDVVAQFNKHRDRIQFLILDIIMPKLNGKEAYQIIARQQRGVKVLFTSSYSEDVVRQKNLLDRSMNFILKPFSSKELLARVSAIR